MDLSNVYHIYLRFRKIHEIQPEQKRTKKKTVSEIVVLGFSHIIRAKVVVE